MPAQMISVRMASAFVARRVTSEAYLPMAKAASAADIARFTDGAATVQIHARLETFWLEEGRRIATAEDVEEFAKLGKRITEGQMVGPVGFVMTRFDATVR